MSKEINDSVSTKRETVRGANFIVGVVEFVLLMSYLGAAFYSIFNASMDFDIVSMFEDIYALAWVLTVAMFAFAIFLLIYKPMRTKYTICLAVFNIICTVLTVYELISLDL